MDIVSVDAGDAEDVAALVTAWRRAIFGLGEPACTGPEAAAWWNPRPNREPVGLVAVEGARQVGYVRAQLSTNGARHGFVPELFVEPSFRRRRVATALVHALASLSRAHSTARLVLRQDDADPGGAAFADSLGATRGFRGLQNRCVTAEIDVALLEAWVERAAERAEGWSLVGWRDRCPDELLDAFVDVQAAMHGAPVPSVAMVHGSAADIRQAEASAVGQGLEHWVLAARLDRTGELGGFTELGLVPWQPWLAHQGDTGVMPVRRQLGLGRWLKAEMALRLLAERPEVAQIETNTAEDNPSMRSINEAMGFRAVVVWQDRELDLTGGGTLG